MRLLWLTLFISFYSFAQQNELNGVVKSTYGELLGGASITIYHGSSVSGIVANKEGAFLLPAISFDSIKISMVGYSSKVYLQAELTSISFLQIQLLIAPAEMETVVVKSLTALDIVKKAIAKILVNQPQQQFENKGFYREVIKDKKNYFSVAEAIFTAQYFPEEKEYKLRLEQGRSKEDVSYTRLFEDFHPGGGPQAAADNSFITDRPAFLNLKEINNFRYKIDSVVSFDGRKLYQVSFDQKADVKKALEKGVLLIDKEDFAVVRFDVRNSPIGSLYIKDLTGSDKIIANLLNIDFKRKGWKRRSDFTHLNEKWVMSYATAEYDISYKQPKKDIDVDLTIKTELVFTELAKPIAKKISKDEAWKKKNIVANLPTAFDANFWGNNAIISPTTEIEKVIAAINDGGNNEAATTAIDDWQFMNRNLFVSYRKNDTITLVPVMKSSWEDDETGGMLFREMDGDFIIESKITFTKNSDNHEAPDRGFQQAGIMIRNINQDDKQNYVLLSAGTGGNPTPKFFFKRTIDNKSKTVISKNETMNGWLRIEKSGNKVIAWFKEENASDFKKAGEYNLEWVKGKVQIGLAVFAAFGGDGPKMKPDMRVNFSNLKIEQL